MDDYYTLIGVDPDADVDTIRTAYRTRKDEATGDDAKKLNKAWNVLSDPYQRGRYDEQRAHGGETDDVEVVDDEPSTNGSSRPTKATTARKQRAPLKPTITLPKGLQFASRRQRLIAMVIDLIILFVMFFGITQVAAPAYAKHQKPEVVNAINNYQDQIDSWNKVKAQAPKVAKGQTNHTTSFADAQISAITKKRDDEISKLNSILFGSLGLAFLLGFLYLTLPSMKSGQTLGKRLQHIRVVRDDGSPIRSGDVIRRYGIIVLATFALYILLRELAGAVVLLGTTRWLSNANQQGMHDRFAHTIVVQDET